LDYSLWRDSKGQSDRWYFNGYKPNKASWLVFVGIEIAWLTSALMGGESFLLNVAYVLGNGAILFLAYRLGGKSEWSDTDKVCASIGGLAILAGLAAAFAKPEVAHYITIGGCSSAYLVGVWPTLRSVWKDPKAEPWHVWLLWLVGSFFYLYVELGKGEFGSTVIMVTVVLEEAAVLIVIAYKSLRLRVVHA